MNAPKISIIVPAYNAEPYVRTAMQSLLDQTLEDIEIIAVDDGSKDETASLLRSYAERDDRVVMVTHERNRGCLAAHVSGIMAASGDYCTFMAADDYLSPETCEACYDVLHELDVDILQFGIEPFADGDDLSEEDEGIIRAFSSPLCDKILDPEGIGEACFVEGTVSWNVAGKMIRTSLCRAACSNLADLYLNFAEDCYLFYFVCLEACSYAGLPDADFYHYRIGSGISQNKQLDVAAYANICDCAHAFDAIAEYLEDGPSRPADVRWYEFARMRVLRDVVDRLVSYVRVGKGARAFDLLLERWDGAEVAAYADTSVWVPKAELAYALADAAALTPSPATGLGIAVVHRGGEADFDQAVIEREFESVGLSPLLVLSNRVTCSESDRPIGLAEDAYNEQFKRLRISFSSLREQLSECGAGIVLWLDGGKPLTLGEALLVRSAGLKLVVVCREEPLLPVDWSSCTFLGNRLEFPFVACLAHVVLCSNEAAPFWERFNGCVRTCDWKDAESLRKILLSVEHANARCPLEQREALMWMRLFAGLGVLLGSQSQCWRTELNNNHMYHEMVEKGLSAENEMLRNERDELFRRVEELERSCFSKVRSALSIVRTKFKTVSHG